MKRLTVILRRGTLGTRQFTYQDQATALIKATVLAKLHGVTVGYYPGAFLVDASAYYDSGKRPELVDQFFTGTRRGDV